VKKKIVVIGGGTGTYVILKGLKRYSVDLVAVVSMMDSGGSNRVIRDEFGLLPTSDIRQCIVALTNRKSGDLIRKLFAYRYSAGTGISGMSFGNLFMAALTDIYGSQREAIEKTCEFLEVRGKILPVTYEKTNLTALYDNGKQVVGEHEIDEPSDDYRKRRIVRISIFPQVWPNPQVIEEIASSDLIVLGPGDLYTSILPNLVVRRIPETIQKSKAKIVFVVNLMTKNGQVDNLRASDFINELRKYLGKNPDFVLVNNGRVPKKALDWYRKVESKPIEDDLENADGFEVIRGDFVHRRIYKKPPADVLVRSLIRHSPDRLAKTIISLLPLS